MMCVGGRRKKKKEEETKDKKQKKKQLVEKGDKKRTPCFGLGSTFCKQWGSTMR